MKMNKDRSYQSILILAFLATIFGSCGPANRLNDNSGQASNGVTFSENTTDTTTWLKPSHGIRSILEDGKGNLWFSNREFICMFDGSGITYFSEEDGFTGRGSDIHEDSHGVIWIETSIGDSLFGASSFDGMNFTFHPFPYGVSDKQWNSLENDLWFSKPLTSSGKWNGPPGVYRYRDGKFDFLEFPVQRSDNDHNKYWATSKAIQGKDGTLWFGTIEVVIGFKDGEFTLIDRKKMGRVDDPMPVGIRGLFEDTKGNLWMADNGSGLFVYDGEIVYNFTKRHHLGKNDRDGNTLHRAFSIAEDDDGNMWFGTVYSGIWRFNTTTNEISNYGKELGVASEYIPIIYKTKQGDLLFAGERPAAVYKFNGNSFDRVY